MPIGSSPFLTADVDTRYGSALPRRELPRVTSPDAIVSARLELIRRRVLTGYYLTPSIADDIAQRLTRATAAVDDA